jgi:hypothetical protein
MTRDQTEPDRRLLFHVTSVKVDRSGGLEGLLVQTVTERPLSERSAT